MFGVGPGALSSDAVRAHRSAAGLHIAEERSYGDFREMARAEAARPDGIDVVAIVTPNHMHAAAAIAFLEAGIHVICDKPLTHTLEDAQAVAAAVARSGRVFGLTHNYTGYPMIRQARAMVVTSGIERAIQYFHAMKAYLLERKSPYQAIVAFSGEHEYGGAKVSEASLNGFPSKDIAD